MSGKAQSHAESAFCSSHTLLLVCFNPSAGNPSISGSQILRAYLWTEVLRVVQASLEGQSEFARSGGSSGPPFSGSLACALHLWLWSAVDKDTFAKRQLTQLGAVLLDLNLSKIISSCLFISQCEFRLLQLWTFKEGWIFILWVCFTIRSTLVVFMGLSGWSFYSVRWGHSKDGTELNSRCALEQMKTALLGRTILLT